MMNPYTQYLPERLAVWRARWGKRALCALAAALIVAVAIFGWKYWQQRQTALAAAKALYQAANAQAAKVQLQWAADVAIDVEYRQIARLRLSALLLEEKAYDEALRVLNSGASTPAFAALRAQQRGDALAAQGQREQARAAYRDALQSLDAKNTAARQWVQLKLNALGG